MLGKQEFGTIAAMLVPRLELTEGMRRLLDYPRFRGQTRMLILDTGYFFDASWERAGQDVGWGVARVSSAMMGGLTREQLAQFFSTLCEFRPDFILTSNYTGMDSGGLLARFLEDARIPYITWFTDTPRGVLTERVVHANPYAVAAVWERFYIPFLESLGFENVLYWPHATDPVLFQGGPQSAWTRPVAFVGRSMVAEREETWEWLEPYPQLAEAVQNAFATGRVTRLAYAQGVAAILGTPFVAGASAHELRLADLCLNYEHTYRQRVALAQALTPLGAEFRGDLEWSRLAARTGGGVGYFDDLAPYYRDTQVNVNATALQMPTAVNQRLFDCPAAGGFLLTDAQSDARELFADDELALYEDAEELRNRAAYFLAHPGECRAIVLRAQRRIAAEHTHAHRLLTLEKYLRTRFA